jgi:adenylylsulfate kinase
MDPVPTLVITGPVGVGKTGVAAAISDVLTARSVAHAKVDLDALRAVYPRPPEDPFHAHLGLRNLAAVWANARAAGAGRLVLADVVESRADVEGYKIAVPGATVQVVRLRAAIATIWARLDGRETGESLEWHRQRAVVLAAQMDRDRIEDLLVDNEGRSLDAVAQDILERAGW